MSNALFKVKTTQSATTLFQCSNMPVYAYFDIIENQSTGEGCVVVEEEEPGEGFSQKNMFKLGDFISLVTYDLLA